MLHYFISAVVPLQRCQVARLLAALVRFGFQCLDLLQQAFSLSGNKRVAFDVSIPLGQHRLLKFGVVAFTQFFNGVGSKK